MKKFIIAFIVLFIVNLGCKKIIDQPVCACSPLPTAYLSLVIKNAAGDDLLSPTIKGAFVQNQIQLYSKDANGNTKQIVFYIRPPFSYGSDQFNYYQLFSYEIGAIAQTIDQTFYLKLGNNTPYELNLQVNTTIRKVEKLLIDKKEAPVESGKLTSYNSGVIYYLML